MKTNYWQEIGIGFIILIIALSAFFLFYKPAAQIEEGFTEKYCISLLSQHNKDAGIVKLQSSRLDEQLLKDGLYASEENVTIRVFLETNRYEGLLEYCRLSEFSFKQKLVAKYTFQCKYGELKVDYGQTNRYKYIFQELKIEKDKSSLFLTEILNLSKLSDLQSAHLETLQNFYQASYIYVNPELPDIYAIHIDAFIDTLGVLGCKGQIPQDLIDLSTYTPTYTIQTE